MENTSLICFLEVCSCGSISKAGKNLHVTPQAVSKSIQAFEKKLGYPLLVRSREGCVPTAKGIEVQQIGIRLQRFQQQALQQIYSLSQIRAKPQEVHIGVWNSFATIMPVSDFSDFNELHPEITLCIHSYPNMPACEHALVSGEVELAFCGREREGCGFTSLHEYHSSPVLIVNGKSRLADSKKIHLADLRGEKLIADYAMDRRTIVLEKEIRSAGLTPVLILPLLSDTMKRYLVLHENYVAFSYCPVGWLPGGLVPLNISDIRNHGTASFAKAENAVLSSAAQQYANYIIPRFKKDIFR